MKSHSQTQSSLTQAMEISPGEGSLSKTSEKRLFLYSLFWSVALLCAAMLACVYSGEGLSVFSDLYILVTSPSKLITDYFDLGGLAATFLNAALCGFACDLMMLLTKARPSATMLAAYFLVIAHCFYGLNILNMWPPLLGVLVFSAVARIPLGENLHIAMFATSLAPFISDLLFRYPLGDGYVFGEVHITPLGVLLALLFGLLAGFTIPALLPGTTKMHRGYNLFKAGLAVGLFGIFAFALFYKTFGKAAPDTVIRNNPIYASFGGSYFLFANLFFAAVFLVTLAVGFFGNGGTFCGYRKIWRCDGWRDDFPKKCGVPLTLINIGLYGFCVLAYFDLAILLTDGVGYTAPTVGVTIAAITFAAAGQTPRNVWPIALGYVLLFGISRGICALCGVDVPWCLSTQAYMNGLAFATGLCPFVGRYSRKVGVIAGMLHAILCSSTAAMHGGFVLYNGGLTAGLTALLLLPILDFYHIKPHPFSEEA